MRDVIDAHHPDGVNYNNGGSAVPQPSYPTSPSDGSAKDFLWGYFNNGHDPENTGDTFKFGKLWEDFMYQQQLANNRQDADTAYQRQQELPNILRSKEYAQLIAMGMSPMAAMQALSGGAGSGAPNVAMPNSSSPVAQGAVGNTQAEARNMEIQNKLGIANSVFNGLSALSSAAGAFSGIGFGVQNLGIASQSLALQREMYEGLNFITLGTRDVVGSDVYKNFTQGWRGMVANGKLGVDAIQSSVHMVDAVRKLAEDGDADAKAVMQNYNKGLEQFPNYWQTGIDAQYEPTMRSVSQGVVNAMNRANTELSQSAKALNEVSAEQAAQMVIKLQQENEQFKAISPYFVYKTTKELQFAAHQLEIQDTPENLAYYRDQIRNENKYKALKSYYDYMMQEFQNGNLAVPQYVEAMKMSQLLESLGIEGSNLAGSVLHSLCLPTGYLETGRQGVSSLIGDLSGKVFEYGADGVRWLVEHGNIGVDLSY